MNIPIGIFSGTGLTSAQMQVKHSNFQVRNIPFILGSHHPSPFHRNGAAWCSSLSIPEACFYSGVLSSNCAGSVRFPNSIILNTEVGGRMEPPECRSIPSGKFQFEPLLRERIVMILLSLLFPKYSGNRNEITNIKGNGETV